MGDYTVTALTPATWDDFAGLAVPHHGVWGGNWCMAFHGGFAKDAGAAGNRAAKVGLVRAGRAHAALVYAGGMCRMVPVRADCGLAPDHASQGI